MKKTKTKAILVKISFRDQVRQIIGKVNNPVLVFVVTLLLGIGIAVGLGYLYSNYRNNIFATDDSIRDTLNYQGKIVNADGVPPPDGQYKMQFKIFNSFESVDNAGLLWTEVWDGTDQNDELAGTQGMMVPVSQGIFTVELNSLCSNWVGNCALEGSGGVTFSQSSYYLQVELDYDGNGTYEEKFLPRKRFTSTPYSMNADKLDGRDSSDFVLKSGATMTGELIAPKVTDSSIIAYYQFNDNVKNSSSYADLDGSIQGSASLGSDILFLDGVDSHVLVNDNENLSFGNGTLDSAFTFSAWINMNNSVNFPIVSKGVYNTNAEYFFGTDIDGKLTVRIYDESLVDCYIGRRYAAYSLSSGSWLHVSATYNGNGTAAGLKLYLNGELVDDADSSVTCSYVAMENLASALYLGKYGANYANGKVDEVKIQNRALTPAEVRSSYSTSRIKYLDIEAVTTLYLYLNAVDPVNQINESGYLYFDPVFNRLMASRQMFIPEIFPALDNSLSDRDYTHFDDKSANENKVLAYDFSGNSIIDFEGVNNGTANGNASSSNNGYTGYGYNLDASGDYINFDYTGFPADGSFEMWARFNEISNSQTNYLAYFFDGATTSVSLYKDGVSDLKVVFGNSVTIDTGYNIPDNEWHHYVLTWDYDLAYGTIAVYVDGVYQDFASSYSNQYSTVASPADYYLGGAVSANTSLNGSIDSFAMYNYVLTDDEILNHAKSAFNTLYVNEKLKDGIIETTLGSLVSLPSTLAGNNVADPALFGNIYGSNETKKIALSFSEGFGTQTFSNLWDDSIPYEYAYATLYGPSWIKNGMFGNALNFDGVDDYVEVLDDFPIAYDAFDNSADFDMSDFAIEFWINGSTLGNNDKRVISKRVGDVGYEIFYDSTTDALLFFIGDGTNVVTSSSSSSHFSDGKWHHFMVSVDFGNTAAIYRDGNIWDMGTVNIASVTSSISNSANLLIGKGVAGNYFNGKIDSIVLHDLSSSTQFNIYDAYARAMKAPEGLFLIGKNTPGGLGTLSLINQSDNGDAAILGMRNQNNTTGFPLTIWNDNNSSDIYNLMYFGTTTLGGGGASQEYGNLKWDNANNHFIFSKGLTVTGDLEATGELKGTRQMFTAGRQTAYNSSGYPMVGVGGAYVMSATQGFRAMRPGSITGLAANMAFTIENTQGDVTIEARVNDSTVLTLVINSGGTGPSVRSGVVTQARGIDTFLAGDLLTFYVSYTSFAGSSTQILEMEVTYDS